MIRTALLSKWHVHAQEYAEEAIQNEHITLTHVWDEEKERGLAWAEELNLAFEEEIEEIFTNPEIDAVIIASPTNMHTEIITKAAQHGKHVFTEKVLAETEGDARSILKKIEEHGVKLMISLPRLTANYYLYAQKVVDEGLLGKLTTIRCRVAHNGSVPTKQNPNGWLPQHFYDKELCGGGAFIDLGAHPIYLTNRLGGQAKAVTARFKQTFDYEVDDNAVAIVEYESGALGILETGFVSSGSPFQLEIYGTEGTLMIEDDTIRIKSVKHEEGWYTPSEVEMPEPAPSAMMQWVTEILSGIKPDISHQDAYLLTLINDAARRSNEEGCRIELK
ncbi:Gfo/Idh/MocA family oxidoreductase [Bacillus sp. RO1]|uniref:Gfo/Idh/MocA family protein n=1 Tax=Bacillus sp. RO1 TaxID=2722703 RepID=UPI0014578A21|nr:Gfo/Idh/MocA family oxidoreductase [Bacillus sp. RO1]NLP52377.1 Gfo/Idh/MocA family oxidoreductase [Bacillus sp. RO1]